jgi:peptide/nickel transport system substrate-binding protein
MNKFGKRLIAFLIAGAMIFSLAGCGKEEKKSTGDSTGSSTNSAKTEGDTITIASKADLTSLDPHKMNDIASAPAIRSIYETLIRLNPETNEFEPYLAESYEYVEGSDKDIKFKLNEGIKFHNGDPLTSEDVKFSLDRQHSSGNAGHLVSDIDSVEVIDDLTFIIHLKQPTSTIISSLAHMCCSILDKEYVEKMDAENKSLDEGPVGTGPYMFDKWTLGSQWSLKKNPNYWNDKFKAQADRLVCKVIPEETSRTVALQAGEIDLLLNVPNVDIENIKKDKNIDLMEYQSTALEFLALNCSKEPFNNKALREAVAYCVNRDDIIQVQFDGQATPCYTCIGPAAIGYTDDVEKREYNIEKAKEKLVEGGKPDGFSFTISTFGDTRARACQVIQAACKEAGIDVKIETLEKSAYYDKIGHANHEAAYSGWNANAEPDNTYRPLYSSATIGTGGANASCFKSDEIDKLIDEGSKLTDNDAKVKKYEEVAKIVAKECAVIPTCSEKGYIAKSKNVDGMVISPIQNHDFFGLHIVK